MLELLTSAPATAARDRFEPFDTTPLKVADLRDSIATVGLILPLVVSPSSDGRYVIRDGRHRAAAAFHIDPAACLPIVEVGSSASRSVMAAAAMHRASTQHRIANTSAPSPAVSRKTLERALNIVGIAADTTLPIRARAVAAEAIRRIDRGEPVAAAHREAMAAVNAATVTARYPQLSGLPEPHALRLAAHLDGLEPQERELELATLALTTGSGDTSAPAMSVYLRLRETGELVTGDRASELVELISTAAASGDLSPALRERATQVADGLATLASGIRSVVDAGSVHA